jgi:alpha-beta hydrolase superfamily lysophospholipase
MRKPKLPIINNRDKVTTESRIESLQHTLFQPQNQPVKGSILILHGMMEHRRRYVSFARYLSERGFAVMTYDHLGHGHTAKQPDDLGFFQLKNPAEQLVSDAEQMAHYLEKLFPTVPHFLLGHSMGSFVARCLLQRAGSRFDGAVIMGTGDKIGGAKLGRALLGMLNQVAPKYRSHLINSSFRWMNNRHFKREEPNDGTNWLSVDKENRASFLQDPLCGIDFTNNGFYTLLSLVVQATGKGWAKPIPKHLPMFFVSGEEDPIGNFGQGVNKTVQDLQQEGFKNITMKLYPGMRHEILNEGIKQQVYQDIKHWLTTLAA